MNRFSDCRGPVIAFGNSARGRPRGRLAAIECRSRSCVSRKFREGEGTNTYLPPRAVSSILRPVASIRRFNEFNRRSNMPECWPETSISRRSFQFSAAGRKGGEGGRGGRFDNFAGEFLGVEVVPRPRFSLRDWFPLACSPGTHSRAAKP